MKNQLRKKPAPPQNVSETQTTTADSLQQQHFSKKEKLQVELETKQAIEGLQDGQKRSEQDWKKLRKESQQRYQEFLDEKKEVHDFLDKYSKLTEQTAQRQKELALAQRDQVTIQEAMDLSDTMYRRMFQLVDNYGEISKANEERAFKMVEMMDKRLEKIRQHMEVLVKIKTDINLDAEQVRQIVEPVSAEMKQYVDKSLEKLNGQTNETLETILSQSFSEYAAAQEEAVQRQEAAAERAERAAEQALEAVAAQEANRGWQQQALSTLGTLSLQAASVTLGALVFLGPIAAIFGLTGAPGFMQWLTDFGSQGVGQAALAVLIFIVFVVLAAGGMAIMYRVVDGALRERKGEKALSNMEDSVRLSKARRKGDEAFKAEITAQAQRKLAEKRRRDES
ncbi:hypothetical protein MHX62_07170 [Corynebacterium sp. ACRQM]|uniref:hypothetical protein n=1 Tax=unclassified Corynebacterium TaxID=2624378 RepID=UPI001EF51574|nr:hypothetical protein [Corynebacterium sp. ACRPR]MCG7234114.1 hypothetical protein [Corynebacterium sp. ACRPR]MCG7271840.1 hypothetical protein [Corynebacterium sp. ACRQM]